jgi:hypothetical protein
MFKFKKPSGVIVEVNADSRAYALSIGWVEIKDEPAAEPKPKARQRKAAN